MPELYLHNHLTRRKERFEPVDPSNVRIYVCGPTVYDLAHVGNARPEVVYDVLVRLLRRLFPKVTHVRNITDVEDKINARAAVLGISIGELTAKTTNDYHQDVGALGVPPPDVEPTATGHIAEMIQIIERLIASGNAYEAAQQLYAQGQEVALLALFDTMNWCNIPSDNAFRKVRQALQRIKFHTWNFLLLNTGEKKKFFNEKVKVLRSRSTIWKGMLMGKLRAKQSGDKSESVVLAEMWRINDTACVVYQAEPYDGIITDFRPMRQYAKYSPAEDDWSRLARGGHEILTLPVYPAGRASPSSLYWLAIPVITCAARICRWRRRC